MASKDKPPNNDQQQEDENYQDYSEYSLFTQCISELMGTFVLVMIGCGAECVSLYVDESSSNAVWQVPLLGFVGATLGIYSAASISSGHLNPAVTLSFAVVRPGLFPFRKVIPYWIAQVCGAILAGMTNFLLFYHAIEKYEEKYLSSSSSTKKKGGGRSGKKSTESECTEYDRNYLKSASAFGNFWSLSDTVSDQYHAFFIEAFGTAFLVFTIFIVTSPSYPIPGAAVPPIVGLAIGAMMVIFGPLTGASINPARDLGPRLVAVSMHWGVEAMTDFLPYIVGPLVGGPIGAWFAETILSMS